MTRSVGDKRKREFAKFLRWVQEEPQPWILKYIREQRERWKNWKRSERRGYVPKTPTEFWTNAPNADIFAWRQAFYYARRMRYIQVEERGTRFICKLTDKGKRALFRQAVVRAPQLQKPWVLLVVYDIPEGAYKSRNALRYFLKEHGFRKLQLSIWYTTTDLREPLQNLLGEFGIGSWVQVLLAKCPTLYQ